MSGSVFNRDELDKSMSERAKPSRKERLTALATLISWLFSGISGCHLALGAGQELIEPPTHRVVDRMFLFITRMAPQGPARFVDVF